MGDWGRRVGFEPGYSDYSRLGEYCQVVVFGTTVSEMLILMAALC